jgi:3-oxoadipate enol-lactonase
VRPTVAVYHAVEGRPDAPAVVLSNSLGATPAMWDPQMPALTQSFRVIRYDHRGHGRSPAPPGPYDIEDLGHDLVALLDRLGVARAHVFGVSIGGMVGMWVAAHAPDRVDRLVLCSTSSRLGPPEAWAERAATVRAKGTAAVADAVVARWFTPAYAARNPGTVAEMRAMLAATPAEGYAACCGAVERMDLRADLGAIRAPTLVIAGADDPATPPSQAERIADGITGSRLVVIEDAAHLVNVEQVDAVDRLVIDHLSGEPDEAIDQVSGSPT